MHLLFHASKDAKKGPLIKMDLIGCEDICGGLAQALACYFVRGSILILPFPNNNPPRSISDVRPEAYTRASRNTPSQTVYRELFATSFLCTRAWCDVVKSLAPFLSAARKPGAIPRARLPPPAAAAAAASPSPASPLTRACYTETSLPFPHTHGAYIHE